MRSREPSGPRREQPRFPGNREIELVRGDGELAQGGGLELEIDLGAVEGGLALDLLERQAGLHHGLADDVLGALVAIDLARYPVEEDAEHMLRVGGAANGLEGLIREQIDRSVPDANSYLKSNACLLDDFAGSEKVEPSSE